MADMTIATLTDLLKENYGQLFIDLVVREGEGNWLVPEQTFLGRLRRHGKVFIGGADGSNRYAREWGLKVAGKTASSFGINDAYPVAEAVTYDDASIAWKRTGEMVAADNLARLTTGRASMRDAIPALNKDMADAFMAIIDDLDTQLAGDGTGNDSKDIDGFAAFLSTANTYAGIAQGAQALWQANIVAGGAAALTNTMMRTMVRNAWNRNALGPNTEIWMDLLQFQKFSTLHADNIRYQPNTEVGAPKPFYADGAHAIPIHVVQGVPTSEVHMFNMDDLEYRMLDHNPEDEASAMSDLSIVKEGVPFGLEAVQSGKDSKQFFLKVYSNLVCVNPYRQSAITNLATTAP